MFRQSALWMTLVAVFGPCAVQAQQPLEGEYFIESALKPGQLIDVCGAKTDDGTLIQLAGPGNQINRRWRLIPLGEGAYLIETALKKGHVLDVAAAKTEKGTPIQLGGSADQPQGQGQNRRWRLIRVGDNGEYRIESILKEGMVLEVTGGKGDNLAPIQLGGPEDEAKNRWRFIRVDFGK